MKLNSRQLTQSILLIQKLLEQRGISHKNKLELERTWFILRELKFKKK